MLKHSCTLAHVTKLPLTHPSPCQHRLLAYNYLPAAYLALRAALLTILWHCSELTFALFTSITCSCGRMGVRQATLYIDELHAGSASYTQLKRHYSIVTVR